MNIYEIDSRIQDIIANAVDPETGEVRDFGAELEGLQMAREQKTEGAACAWKNIMAEAEAIREEEKALAERRKRLEKEGENLKAYLLYATQGEKFSTSKCAISFRRSASVEFYGPGDAEQSEAEFIEWAQNAHDDLLTYKAPTVNKTAVKKAIQAGEELPFAYMAEKVSIQIK